MITENGDVSKICLEGDWSMAAVTERFPLLANCFSGLLDSSAAGRQQESSADPFPVIDLSGVTNFDACGCQLLALFVQSLKQNGIHAQLTNMSDTLRSKVDFLGFDRVLDLTL